MVNGFRFEFRSGTERDLWSKYKSQISANIRDASVPGLPLVITAVMLARMLKRAEWITSANVVILNAREIVGVLWGDCGAHLLSERLSQFPLVRHH